MPYHVKHRQWYNHSFLTSTLLFRSPIPSPVILPLSFSLHPLGIYFSFLVSRTGLLASFQFTELSRSLNYCSSLWEHSLLNAHNSSELSPLKNIIKSLCYFRFLYKSRSLLLSFTLYLYLSSCSLSLFLFITLLLLFPHCFTVSISFSSYFSFYDCILAPRPKYYHLPRQT